MSINNHSASIDMLDTGAMSIGAAGLAGPGHDEGLCHDHHWARDTGAERASFPTVADASRVCTPSSAMHDDIHYAS